MVIFNLFMRLYLNETPTIKGINPKKSVQIMYLALDGIYVNENDKIYKYSIPKIEKTTINITDTVVGYVSSGLTFEEVVYSIPDQHIKLEIVKERYTIDHKLSYVIENKNDAYFETAYKINDIMLKSKISSLI